MKKTLIILALLAVSTAANSQVLISLFFGDMLNSEKVEFGLDGGVNFADISGIDQGEPLLLFNLGFYFDIKFTQNWMLHTGLLVKSSQGVNALQPYSTGDPDLDEIFTNGSVTRKINYFSVPVLAKDHLTQRFHIEAGPMLSLRTKGYDEFSNSVNEEDDISFRLDIRDSYKRIDAGIMCGAGLKLNKSIPKSIQMGVRYYYGLVDPLIDNTGDSQNFSSLYLYVSIPIGVQKAEKKQE